ncbi:MAG: hypothetical protein HKN57_09235 [Xanthomonadales bacterium]|nr:hypothetical protein [Gammaproteobacteria bacterium]MBT8054045.1 hypothetical protein [Gammaproteobacteria bacterium]NND57424.1 hypothetical protein [Xanthomonadales bacterium]NNK50353.1 hypothetical protein [Xanthomonadales bacterium]
MSGLFRKLAACLLAIALLAGCSTAFTYNQLDWLIPWYVDDYVDLSRDQRKLLRGQLSSVLQWHREQELVNYIAILDRIESDLSQPVEAATVQSWIDEITSAGQRVEESMMPVALGFGAKISTEQMEEFTASLWERQREAEEEFLSRSEQEYIRESHDNLVDFLERFTGRLSSAQKQRLLLAASSLHRFDAAWLDDRANWLTRLEPLLQRPEGWQDAVIAAYGKRRESRTPEYNEILDHNLQVTTVAVADVLNDLTGKQRRHAAKEIGSLRSTLQKLISKSKSA